MVGAGEDGQGSGVGYQGERSGKRWNIGNSTITTNARLASMNIYTFIYKVVIKIEMNKQVPKVSHHYSTYWEWWCCAIPPPVTSNNSDNNSSSIVTTGSVSGTATVCTLHSSVAMLHAWIISTYLHFFISSISFATSPSASIGGETVLRNPSTSRYLVFKIKRTS